MFDVVGILNNMDDFLLFEKLCTIIREENFSCFKKNKTYIINYADMAKSRYFGGNHGKIFTYRRETIT
jgi:hypothetical protein